MLSFLDCCVAVDVASISEGQELTLAEPVPNHPGRNILAPDFRKARQTALAQELLKPKHYAYGFRTCDLLHNLSAQFRNSAQIRYEMNKFRVRGIIGKVKGQSFYKVTKLGWKWL